MRLSRKEFIVLMAALMSLTALSIDGVLPALSLIQQDLSVQSENHVQFVIGVLFAGLMVGQLIFGPIADSYGRKAGILFGLVIFIIGSLASLFATSFTVMLLGRFLQGFGTAAARVISVAIVRDLYSGRDMAQIMSFIMTVFILVPMIAPLIGEGILIIANWHMIFVFYLMCGLSMITWVYKRLDETLAVDKRKNFSLRVIAKDLSLVAQNKITMGYTLASGLIFSSFLAYLSSSRQIFQDFFDTGQLFALYFGVSAFSVGLASLLNGLVVKRFGMKRICSIALTSVVLISILFMALFDLSNPDGLFIPYMICTLLIFFCYGLLFGNINTLAMEPMGDMAGTASAVIGSLSTAIALVGGIVIGQAFDMSLWPLMIGFSSLGFVTLILHVYLQTMRN